MANWKEPKNDYKPEDQVVPAIFNTLGENERYLQEKKITTEQVQDATVNSTQSASRESLGDKETVKGFFGKIRKWFADLRALAFKGTVGTADIDSSAVTSAKIATGAVTSTKLGSSAVTAAKIASNAVETAKIKDSAVTDAKINSVSASKVTGLHKVATSGSYNDLKDKPSISGGGVSFRKLKGNDSRYNAFALSSSATYTITTPSKASNLIMVQGMLTCANKYWITLFLRKENPWNYATDTPMLMWLRSVNGQANVSYGFISIEASLSGNTLYISGWKINQSTNEYGKSHERASNCYFALDSVYEIIDNGTSGSTGGTTTPSTQKTWQLLTADNFQVQGDYNSNSVTVYVPGLKKGDEFKFTALSVKVNEDPNHECYFYNSPDGNLVYGFTYDGSSTNDFGIMTGWYQHTSDYDYPMGSELEFLSSAPYSGEVGVVDYYTTNRMTIKVSCKQDNYLTVEWSDSAGMYVEMMPIYNIYVLK